MKVAALTTMFFVSFYCQSQSFPVNGQLASTAFPVCGADSFKQLTVPIGTTHIMSLPNCVADSLKYLDTNPFWYAFTCFVGGTLGFLITPNNPQDDYDWMIYDVTGHDPDDAYTTPDLIVTGNWAGTPGLTGARNGGSAQIKCASFPPDSVTTFSNMPVLVVGHHYLLFISHYNQTQSGYSLYFGGGTAIISDSRTPGLQSASMFCDRKTLTVVLNKKMKCASLAGNGSDFAIASNPGAIISATSSKCSNAFDMDSIIIGLNYALSPGDYKLISQTGTDGNTLLDDCGSALNVGATIHFTVAPVKEPMLDSIVYSECSPNFAQLIFSDSIICSTIAPDGSDFEIRGNQSVGISAAAGYCINGFSKIIRITFDSTIVTGGKYQLLVKTGNDGNTILNQCGIGTEANTFLSFLIKDTVSASFFSTVSPGCNSDTIHVTYSLKNQVNQWEWLIVGTNYTSSEQEPLIIQNDFGPTTLQHIVSNGSCIDTASQSIYLENHPLKASFTTEGGICPQDLVSFNNTSSGDLISWSWNFDDGSTSIDKNPAGHLFPNVYGGKIFNISLIVENTIGCYDTATAQITKLQSCAVGVPNAFTPNGDGLNDYLYPANALNVTNLEFRVYNRFGQVIFESHDGTKKWDGKLNGQVQPTGTYIWMLSYTDLSGRKINQTGSTVLIR